MNKTLEDMIATFVSRNQLDWDAHLPLLTAAYRSTTHPSTGYTPNMLMFGREANLPVHLLLGCSPEKSNDCQTVPEYVSNLQDRLHDAFAAARECLKQSAERQKRDYDTRISERSFSAGDLVYCSDNSRSVGRSPKIESHWWRGPYVVT